MLITKSQKPSLMSSLVNKNGIVLSYRCNIFATKQRKELPNYVINLGEACLVVVSLIDLYVVSPHCSSYSCVEYKQLAIV